MAKKIKSSYFDKATVYSAEIVESVRRKERKEGRPLFLEDETVMPEAEAEKPRFEPVGTVDIKKKEEAAVPVFDPKGTVDIKKKEEAPAPVFDPKGTVDIKKKDLPAAPKFEPAAMKKKSANPEEKGAEIRSEAEVPKFEPTVGSGYAPVAETAPKNEAPKFQPDPDYNPQPEPKAKTIPEGLRRYLDQKKADKERTEAARAANAVQPPAPVQPVREQAPVQPAEAAPAPKRKATFPIRAENTQPAAPAQSAPAFASAAGSPPVPEQAADAVEVKEQPKEATGSGKAPLIRSNMPVGSTVLKVSGLTKHFGERVAVNNVSFEVYAGEIFGFLGPNGSGKTTTIRMICGLASITEGEAEICGISVKKNFKKAVSNIGGIIENPEMYKYMTGWDNMKYYASLYSGITDEQIMDVVRLVRMEKRIDEKVKRYSLGMRQRVGIAQSLLHNPKILLLDEPTNGLDPAGIHEMRDFLKMLAHERGIAVFISSHILTEMQLMCDRVGIVSNGTLVAVKTIDEWTDATEANKLIKLRVSDPDKATRILNRMVPRMEVKRNGGLLVFTLPHELLPALSIELATGGVAVLGLTIGEKTLEETFLELTGQGAAIN